MNLIRRVLACTALAAGVASGSSAFAQDATRERVSSKIRDVTREQGLTRADDSATLQPRRDESVDTNLNVAGVTCDEPPCFTCNFGDCAPSDLNDGLCDCLCQFADNADCGSNCNCPSNCDFCWCNTSAENNCPIGWNGADDGCDCACQFTDSDCSTTAPTGACCTSDNACSLRTQAFCSSDLIEGAYYGDNTTCGQVNCSARCAAGCEACWVGTPREDSCDPDYEGDGHCDCGCQFVDPDCGPQGACCVPANGECDATTQLSCVSYLAGVFRGVGTSCGNANCQRCDPGCKWCWKDTVGEHACLPGWADDGECDCGCQFADLDCDPGVCGDLVCDANARQCPDDCKDLRAVAAFQNCFRPGAAEPPQCYEYIYANPIGIGLEDYAVFRDLISGP